MILDTKSILNQSKHALERAMSVWHTNTIPPNEALAITFEAATDAQMCVQKLLSIVNGGEQDESIDKEQVSLYIAKAMHSRAACIAYCNALANHVIALNVEKGQVDKIAMYGKIVISSVTEANMHIALMNAIAI